MRDGYGHGVGPAGHQGVPGPDPSVQALVGLTRNHRRDRIDEEGHESRHAIDERGTVVRR
jgi:hypothetical protein